MESSEKYPFIGDKFTAKIACYWARIKLTPGIKFRSKWLMVDAAKLHIDHGGLDSGVDKNSIRKSALKQLNAQQVGNQYILPTQDPIPELKPQGELESQNSCLNETDASTNQCKNWIGEGNQTVYAFTYQMCIDNAQFKNQSDYDIKIGRTFSSFLDRVSSQCGTSMPQYPLRLLGIRCDDCILLEDTIHKILECRGKKNPDSPGKEWFRTSLDELKKIFEFIYDLKPTQ